MSQRNGKLTSLLIVFVTAFMITGCGSPVDRPESAAEEQVPLVDTEIAPADDQDSQPEALEPSVAFSCLPGIVPGVTTKEEVIQLMGEPLFTEPNIGDGEILYYVSDLEEVPNALIMKGDVVEGVSVLNRDDLLDAGSIKTKFGESEKTTYSYFSQGALTYLYPQYGFTVTGEQEGGPIYLLECFAPITLEDYMKGPGSSLPLEDPYIR